MLNIITLALCASMVSGPALPPADTAYIQDATSFIEPAYQPLARKLSIAPESLPTAGNEFEIIRAGRHFGDLLYDDFRNAQELIELELFLFCDDRDGREARDILFSRVADGVKVCYVHDNFGNFFDSIFDGRPVMAGYFDAMSKGGITKYDFAPLLQMDPTYTYPGQRNHRKIFLIDKKIAYTGGMNISEGSISGWGDCHLRITGPTVQCLRSIFSRNWNKSAKKKSDKVNLTLIVSELESKPSGAIMQCVPDGADTPGFMAEEAMVSALENAKEYVWFETPYFNPPKSVIKAMMDAARRGIDVRVIIPSENDLPAFEPAFHVNFKECLASGVKVIYRKPPFNHSKTFLVDDYVVSIGTTNLDKISIKRNYEVNTYIYDRETALLQKEYLLEAQEGSRTVDQAFIDAWDSKEYFLQGLLGLMSPFL